MTEKEVKEYFDSEDKKRGLGNYASEKREMGNMFEKMEREAAILERQSLKLEVFKTTISMVDKLSPSTTGDLLDLSEAAYQWITKPE